MYVSDFKYAPGKQKKTDQMNLSDQSRKAYTYKQMFYKFDFMNMTSHHDSNVKVIHYIWS